MKLIEKAKIWEQEAKKFIENNHDEDNENDCDGQINVIGKDEFDGEVDLNLK